MLTKTLIEKIQLFSSGSLPFGEHLLFSNNEKRTTLMWFGGGWFWWSFLGSGWFGREASIGLLNDISINFYLKTIYMFSWDRFYILFPMNIFLPSINFQIYQYLLRSSEYFPYILCSFIHIFNCTKVSLIYTTLYSVHLSLQTKFNLFNFGTISLTFTNLELKVISVRKIKRFFNPFYAQTSIGLRFMKLIWNWI